VPNATEVEARNLKAVPVDHGVATIELGPLARGTAIDVKVQIKDTSPPRRLLGRRRSPDVDGARLGRPRPQRGLRRDPAYSVGGLPASTAFSLALWNASGNGESSLAGTVTTDAAGVARFAVPLHAAFSLTTVPVFLRWGDAVGARTAAAPRP
jgi:hypothetical protein